MNQPEIDDLMRRVRPVAAPSRLHQAGQELLEEIMSSTDDIPDVTPIPWRRRTPPRVWWLVGVAAALALVVPLALTTLARGRDHAAPASPPERPPYSVPGNPWLVLDATGWQLESLYQGSERDGSMIYRRGQGQERLTISWLPVALQRRTLERLTEDAKPTKTIGYLGHRATIYDGPGTWVTVLPLGQVSVSLRATGLTSAEDFDNLLGNLTHLDEKTWPDHLGDTVVTPRESAAEAVRVTADIKLPAGVEAADLRGEFPQDRYYFGMDVLNVVACGWLEDYTRARRAGDERTMAEADAALGEYPHWTLLQEMNRTGDWGMAIPVYATRVASRSDVSDYPDTFVCD